MQILPLTFSPDNISQGPQSQASDFLSYLDEEQNELENEETEGTKETDGIYSRHTTDGYTYTLDEVCFTKEELVELYNSLLKNNAPAKDLEKLKSLTELPGGANLGQVMLALKGQKKDVSVSDEDANNISQLAGSVDPSGMLESSMLNALYNNDPLQALRSLRDALDEMSETDTLTVAKSDLLSLGRAMGLSDGAMGKIESFFNGEESGTVTPQGMKKLLSPAEGELLSEKKNRQALDNALGKTLTSLLNKARSRMEKEAAAANEKTRKAAQSQVMIDRTVQKETRQTLNAILDSAQKSAEKTELSQESIEDLQHFGISELDIMRMKNSTPEEKRHFDQNPEKGRQEFASLIHTHDVRPAQQPLFTASQAIFSAEPTGAQFAQQNPAMNQTIPAHLASQVQSGILTTMQDGATRLQLQLHPQELGNLAITLVAHNGEVSAHIRADKAETVEMLNRQAEAIRISLEEQGIKIDNIEIELRDDQHQSADQQYLQDMQQRHTFQEENARRDQLRRLRNIAAVEAEENSPLERNMQDDKKQTTSNRILDRVA